MVVLFVLSSVSGFTLPVMAVLALFGLTGRSRDRRQLAAISCAALLWSILWVVALVWLYIALLVTPIHARGWEALVPLVPPLVLAVVGPGLTAVVGRRLWHWAQAAEPWGPGPAS